MEFIDPTLKQKHKKRLTIGYALLTVLVALATYILVATAMGYQILQRDGQIIQNGIVFLESKPTTADIYLNGKKESNKTNTSLTLPEGEYEIILKSEGYKDWTKRITIEGGKVLTTTYPRFFPAEIKTTDLKAYEGKVSGFYTQSPDKRWILFQSDINKLEADIIDTTVTGVPQQVVTIPTSIFGSNSKNIGVVQVIEWSSDNKHILVKYTTEGVNSTFALLDREDFSRSINLNTLFNAQPTKVSLANGKSDQVYMYFASGGILKIGDIKSKILGDKLFDQVLDYKNFTDDRIVYATTLNSTAGKVTVNATLGGKTFLIGETDYDASGQYILDAAEYDGNWYFAAGSKQSEKIHIYKNPQNFTASSNDKTPNIYTTIRAGLPNFASFSPNKRFFIMQSGKVFITYDFERKTSYRVSLSSTLDEGTTVSWIDNYLIQYSMGGRLFLSEFDGKNSRDMASVKSPYNAYIDESFKRLYTINSVSGVNTSQLTKLTLDN